MKLPTIPHDKAMHVLYGIAIALVVLYVLRFAGGVTREHAKAFALLSALIGGVLKEFFDYRANRKADPPVHTVDGWDALATAAGGAIVWLA